jgi:FkbM family methyltransferase
MRKKLSAVAKRIRRSEPDYSKRSFSQCGEDLIVDHIFHQLQIENPSYLDIGAHHPKRLSNTYLFYSRGSRGINVEPDPALFVAFLEDRKEDINLNIGVAGKGGSADFYIMNEPALNTFVKEEADRAHREHSFYVVQEVRTIPVKPVMEIVQQHWNGVFPDFMSLDVEGLDEEVLRSMSYRDGAPTVICVETVTFSGRRGGEKKTSLIDFVQQNGYLIYADTNINTIFVRKDRWHN